eukprot:TRINITY_DN14531_c0_g1_i1.p1 TRINITY_DN14531_c0_g1~~TRINITY_DN14531_c0_g1_i1.p1  ORF type:complete len:1177 (-),score=207.06 TRINITY_DN14531_c0_g1_i1:99-3500(-)
MAALTSSKVPGPFFKVPPISHSSRAYTPPYPVQPPAEFGPVRLSTSQGRQRPSRNASPAGSPFPRVHLDDSDENHSESPPRTAETSFVERMLAEFEPRPVSVPVPYWTRGDSRASTPARMSSSIRPQTTPMHFSLARSPSRASSPGMGPSRASTPSTTYRAKSRQSRASVPDTMSAFDRSHTEARLRSVNQKAANLQLRLEKVQLMSMELVEKHRNILYMPNRVKQQVSSIKARLDGLGGMFYSRQETRENNACKKIQSIMRMFLCKRRYGQAIAARKSWRLRETRHLVVGLQVWFADHSQKVKQLEAIATRQIKRTARLCLHEWFLYSAQFAERNRRIRDRVTAMSKAQLRKKTVRVLREWREVASGEHSRRAVAAGFRKRFLTAQMKLKQKAEDLGWTEDVSFDGIRNQMREEAIEHMAKVRIVNLKRSTFYAFAEYIFGKLREHKQAMDRAFKHYARGWSRKIFRGWRFVAKFERLRGGAHWVTRKNKRQEIYQQRVYLMRDQFAKWRKWAHKYARIRKFARDLSDRLKRDVIHNWLTQAKKQRLIKLTVIEKWITHTSLRLQIYFRAWFLWMQDMKLRRKARDILIQVFVKNKRRRTMGRSFDEWRSYIRQLKKGAAKTYQQLAREAEKLRENNLLLKENAASFEAVLSETDKARLAEEQRMRKQSHSLAEKEEEVVDLRFSLHAVKTEVLRLNQLIEKTRLKQYVVLKNVDPLPLQPPPPGREESAAAIQQELLRSSHPNIAQGTQLQLSQQQSAANSQLPTGGHSSHGASATVSFGTGTDHHTPYTSGRPDHAGISMHLDTSDFSASKRPGSAMGRVESTSALPSPGMELSNEDRDLLARVKFMLMFQQQEQEQADGADKQLDLQRYMAYLRTGREEDLDLQSRSLRDESVGTAGTGATTATTGTDGSISTAATGTDISGLTDFRHRASDAAFGPTVSENLPDRLGRRTAGRRVDPRTGVAATATGGVGVGERGAVGLSGTTTTSSSLPQVPGAAPRSQRGSRVSFGELPGLDGIMVPPSTPQMTPRGLHVLQDADEAFDPVERLRQQALRNAVTYSSRLITWADVVTGLEDFERRRSSPPKRPATAAASLPGLDKAVLNARRKHKAVKSLTIVQAKVARDSVRAYR